jgi:cytochrome c oxidase assembly factor CtaG
MSLTLSPEQLAPAAISVALYVKRAHTLRGTPRAVPRLRQASFYAGVALIVVVLVSPLATLADELFWVHMAEHLLISDAGALLLVLGLTGPLIAPIMRIGVFDRLRVLAHPLVALPLWAIDLYAWHLPALHEAALRHDGLHAIEHLCFIFFSANMWMCLFGPLPQPAWFGTGWKAGYIVAVRLLGAILANVLLFGPVFYTAYDPGEAAHHISSRSDQAIAGGIMDIEAPILTVCLFCWLFLKFARENDERQELLDLAARRGVPLTQERAGRAVSAGRGAELRARIERDAAGVE